MKTIFFTLIAFTSLGKITAQTLDIKSIRKIEKSASNFVKPNYSDALINKDSTRKKANALILSVAEKNIFLHKNIPSVIGKTGMAPAFFNNFSIDLADDKLSLTSGTFTNSTQSNSFGATITAAAPNGSRQIFSPGGKAPYDFEVGVKNTWEFGTTRWNLVKNGITSDTISSISNKWINLSLSGNLSKNILFLNDTLNKTERPFTFEALINFNYLFNSFIIKKYVNRRILWNIGAGVGRFTNYSELDEINLRKGKFSENNQFSEAEVISGRKGEYQVFNGMVLRGSIFKPLTDPFSLTNVHLGFTASSFGIGSSHHLLNTTGGLYFSKWRSEEDDDDLNKKILKELFSIGLIADFKNLQLAKHKDYINNNFKILLSAQIPLNFF